MYASPTRRPRSAVTLIEVLIAVTVVATVVALATAAVQRVRASAARVRCADQLRQLVLAAHAYHASHGRLPPGAADGPDEPYPFLAWHARLLPQFGDDALWRQVEVAFRTERQFYHPPPHRLLFHPLPRLVCPLDVRTGDRGEGKPAFAMTSYLGVIGQRANRPDGSLYLNSATRLTDIADGTSGTLLVGERPTSANGLMGWWYAGWGQDKDGEGDMVLGVRTKNNRIYAPDCPVGPFPFAAGRLTDQCSAFQFWSLHPGGAHFALADGSVRLIRYEADPLLPALATRAGGEAVAPPD